MTLRNLCALAFILGLFAAAGSLRAEERAPDKTTPAAPVQKDDAQGQPAQGGCWFTRFWTHDVGDTIYHGLRTGSRKINHAFVGGSKEQDQQATPATLVAPAAPAVPAPRAPLEAPR